MPYTEKNQSNFFDEVVRMKDANLPSRLSSKLVPNQSRTLGFFFSKPLGTLCRKGSGHAILFILEIYESHYTYKKSYKFSVHKEVWFESLVSHEGLDKHPMSQISGMKS